MNCQPQKKSIATDFPDKELGCTICVCYSAEKSCEKMEKKDNKFGILTSWR